MELTSEQRQKLYELRISFTKVNREMARQWIEEYGLLVEKDQFVRDITHQMDAGYKTVVEQILRILDAS